MMPELSAINGHTDFLDHQEQGTPARYDFHHRVRLSDTCGKHAWTEAAAEEEEIKPYVHSAILTYEDKSMFTFSPNGPA